MLPRLFATFSFTFEWWIPGKATEDMNQLQQELNLQEDRCEVSVYELVRESIKPQPQPKHKRAPKNCFVSI